MIVFDSSLVIMPDRPQVHVLVGLHQTWADFSWTLIVQGLTVFAKVTKGYTATLTA